MTHDAPAAQTAEKTFRYARGPAVHGHHRVTFVELFFDLVFVFAVTQVSHLLIAHPSFSGFYETTLLFFAVWWVWIYTSWATNWANPDKALVRLMLFVLMALGLVMSMAIPRAFGDRGLLFACAYVGSQLFKSICMLKVVKEVSPQHHRNFVLISIWIVFSGVLWIAGALLDPPMRVMVWSVAMGIDFFGPIMRFYVPGLGRSHLGSWDIEPAHFAERCGLFVIIALGEALLVAGSTFANLDWNFTTSMAFVGAFLGTLGMWSIYFNIGQERGAIAMARAETVGTVGRAYTYVHFVIVGGIAIGAVADEFVLAHASGHVDEKTLLTCIGGPLLYLIGCAIFKRMTAGWFPLSHIVGVALLAALYLVGYYMAPWQLGLANSLVLIIVAFWEYKSLGPDGVNAIGHPRLRAKAAANGAGHTK